MKLVTVLLAVVMALITAVLLAIPGTQAAGIAMLKVTIGFAVSSAIVGGVIGGISAAITGNNFWEGVADGVVWGFISGFALGPLFGIRKAVQVQRIANPPAPRPMVQSLPPIAGPNQHPHLWRVGPYNRIQSPGSGLDAHHVGQARAMEMFIPGYNRLTAPAINVPIRGHRVGDIVSRNTKGFMNARQVIARDIWELRRVYSSRGIPASALRELIRLNKTIYKL